MFGGKSFNPTSDIPSLEGKVIVVTGGNTGLGKETVLQLAKHNPKELFLAARTPAKAEAAIEEIKKAAPDANISFIPLDLTSLASVKKAAEEIKARTDRLDVLVNNAGIMMTDYSKTAEGYEIQFGTNHIGHAALVKNLLPVLLKTAEEPGSDVRVVNVSSEGHRLAPALTFDQDELRNVSTMARYGQSKLANIYHARELQNRYPQITATSLHPGVIVTDLYLPAGKSFFGAKFVFALMRPFTPDVPTGTKNQLWAATAPKEEVRKSYYWTPIGSKSGGSSAAQKEDQAKKLWEWTESELEKHA